MCWTVTVSSRRSLPWDGAVPCHSLPTHVVTIVSGERKYIQFISCLLLRGQRLNKEELMLHLLKPRWANFKGSTKIHEVYLLKPWYGSIGGSRGRAGARPLQDPILSFSHTFSLKSAHVGGQNHPKMGPRPPPPLRKILDPALGRGKALSLQKDVSYKFKHSGGSRISCWKGKSPVEGVRDRRSSNVKHCLHFDLACLTLCPIHTHVLYKRRYDGWGWVLVVLEHYVCFVHWYEMK